MVGGVYREADSSKLASCEIFAHKVAHKDSVAHKAALVDQERADHWDLKPKWSADERVLCGGNKS